MVLITHTQNDVEIMPHLICLNRLYTDFSLVFLIVSDITSIVPGIIIKNPITAGISSVSFPGTAPEKNAPMNGEEA